MDTLTNALIDTTGKTLWQLICERAEATPNKRMAIDEKGRTLTFGEYRAWSERVAAGLAAHGIGIGTNVSWILPSRFESLVLAAALSRSEHPTPKNHPTPKDHPTPKHPTPNNKRRNIDRLTIREL